MLNAIRRKKKAPGLGEVLILMLVTGLAARREGSAVGESPRAPEAGRLDRVRVGRIPDPCRGARAAVGEEPRGGVPTDPGGLDPQHPGGCRPPRPAQARPRRERQAHPGATRARRPVPAPGGARGAGRSRAGRRPVAACRPPGAAAGAAVRRRDHARVGDRRRARRRVRRGARVQRARHLQRAEPAPALTGAARGGGVLGARSRRLDRACALAGPLRPVVLDLARRRRHRRALGREPVRVALPPRTRCSAARTGRRPSRTAGRPASR